ncbi:glycerol-3-phosphate 1-O-acyltransferase PlsY [Lentibacillus cibarius]|uniref:Glycerol-3-phosphate acyltransferase n=1 Tax=Lentibacillus cibarius TaxID=2583219 RepID=A0A5S3QSK5_9BACI|nr:glycerol-3-phosphate 1-O-acyltransferase PlsY [Lentibacillus cibarius]TMN23666.1 glycerol-3-phosphate 1-O-acyltransferase PlsY [Lentibacillus cibarius]
MVFFIFAFIAYLLGSIPSGVIIGKLGYNIDIREYGSGNLGATNTFRILGVKAGITVTLVDILKGTTATVLPLLFDVEVFRLAIGLFAVLGHTYPLFTKFKGGKAVATSGGIILGINPVLFAMIILSFFATLYLSKYVSLSSMITGIVAIIVSALFRETGLVIVTAILTILVFYRHRENIKRIKNRTEPKITWM